jgi:uncharacterized membrane protein
VPIILAAHIIAGAFALLFGYIALGATKGATLHRRAGMLFVYAMLTMAVGGFAIAASRGVAPGINIPASVLTAYLVVSALLATRAYSHAPRWLHVAGLAVAALVATVTLTFGAEAIANGGRRDGMPAFPFVMFGVVSLVSAVGDIRLLRAGTLPAPRRLTRHLWRMSFALFIAAMSFFLGQAGVFPRAVRIMPLLALPPFGVLAVMFYWLWKVRSVGVVRVHLAAADGDRQDVGLRRDRAVVVR